MAFGSASLTQVTANRQGGSAPKTKSKGRPKQRQPAGVGQASSALTVEHVLLVFEVSCPPAGHIPQLELLPRVKHYRRGPQDPQGVLKVLREICSRAPAVADDNGRSVIYLGRSPLQRLAEARRSILGLTAERDDYVAAPTIGRVSRGGILIARQQVVVC